jgi:hypothetical protein
LVDRVCYHRGVGRCLVEAGLVQLRRKTHDCVPQAACHGLVYRRICLGHRTERAG